MLSSWYQEDRLSSVFGTVSTASYFGAFSGTGLAIFVQEHYGWRSVFVPASIAGVSVAVLVLWRLKTPKEMNIEVTGKVKTMTKTTGEVDNSFRCAKQDYQQETNSNSKCHF